jgi:Tfp pilus assembly protein PilF
MNQQQNMDARIGEAWKSHRQGQNQQAIEQFLQLLEEAPDNIDAQWGLGLSYRNLQQHENALKIFRKVLDLVETKLESDTNDMERYLMLKRMASQQIESMDEFLDQ